MLQLSKARLRKSSDSDRYDERLDSPMPERKYMDQKENAASRASVESFVPRPRPRLNRDGIPIDKNDWTKTDWADLHHAIEKAKKLIRKRHASDSKSCNA